MILAREDADVVQLQPELELPVGRVYHGVRGDVLHDGVLLAQLARALPLQQHLLLVRQPASPSGAVGLPRLCELHERVEKPTLMHSPLRKFSEPVSFS